MELVNANFKLSHMTSAAMKTTYVVLSAMWQDLALGLAYEIPAVPSEQSRTAADVNKCFKIAINQFKDKYISTAQELKQTEQQLKTAQQVGQLFSKRLPALVRDLTSTPRASCTVSKMIEFANNPEQKLYWTAREIN